MKTDCDVDLDHWEADGARRQVIDRLVAIGVLKDSIEGMKNAFRKRLVERLQTCHWDDLDWALEMFLQESKTQHVKITEVKKRLEEMTRC